jgi:hypothetical protein
MKIKPVLYLVILAGLLASMAALPVLAEEEPIAMWVHRARLAYTGRSPHGPDAVVAFVHIRDATLDMVEGATVTAVWTLPGDDGPWTKTEAVVTNEQGIAVFAVWEGRGDYRLCVTGVTKDGWLWDPTLDREVCPVFTVP